MDQAFLLRARRMLAQRAPAGLDHLQLVAVVSARQAATPTARAQLRCGTVATRAADALPALVLAEGGWAGASVQLSGCFNRAVAVRSVNVC